MPVHIDVVVADPHPIVAFGLSRLLEDIAGWHLLASAFDGAKACELCLELQPDLLVMSLPIPGPEPAFVVSRVRSKCPDTRIVVFCTFTENCGTLGVRGAGADGVISKGESLETLVRAIQTVSVGLTWVSEQCCTEGSQRLEPLRGRTSLTLRQRAIVDRLSEGKTVERIAEELDVSPRTVARDIRRICNTLGLASRSELLVWATQGTCVGYGM